MSGTELQRWIPGSTGSTGDGSGATSQARRVGRQPDDLGRLIEIQREQFAEYGRLRRLSLAEMRSGHPALKRVLGVRYRRNIRLALTLGEGQFEVPLLWELTRGELLLGFALVEEI